MFFLDSIHEDLNRIKKKPQTAQVESNGRPDDVVAKESWDVHLQRNHSIITDKFQGAQS
jgi:ubiquitin C-terminal hydrolase